MSRDYKYYLYILNDRETPKCFEMAALGPYAAIIDQFNVNQDKICLILPKPFKDFLPPIIHTRDMAKLCYDIVDDGKDNNVDDDYGTVDSLPGYEVD